MAMIIGSAQSGVLTPPSWSNRKSFEKTGPPFEVVLFSRSDRLEFRLNGSRPLWPLSAVWFYHVSGHPTLLIFNFVGDLSATSSEFQPRSQGLSSLPPLSLRKDPGWLWSRGTRRQTFSTRVVFSLYFDSATGRKSIRLTRHFLNNWSFSYNVSIKKVKRAHVLYPEEMNSHKSGQPKYKSFRDRQDNFKSSM